MMKRHRVGRSILRKRGGKKRKLEEVWGYGSMATIYQYTSGPRAGSFLVAHEHGKKGAARSLAEAYDKAGAMLKGAS
jgi:hypothetical protein